MNPKELRKQAKALYDEAANLFANGEIEAGDQKETEADSLIEQAAKMEAAQKKAAALRQPVTPVGLPVDDDTTTPTTEQPKPANGRPSNDDLMKAVTILRYGKDIDDPTSVVMREVYEADYRQIDYDQTKALATYLRGGNPGRELSRQYWSLDQVKAMLKDGVSVAEIKATMVEGVDVLGGYAVPPERAAAIIQRMAGLTAVRSAGAMTVTTASKMIEWLKIESTGAGNNRYPANLRGLWGHETTNPTADNFTFGTLQIPVHIYTYKVPMSTSLIEDAQNIVDIFVRLASETLAIDEDEAFLIGDGANKPRGILPGQLNANTLTEVVSGDADDVTLDGLKKLRRGIDSQYRRLGGASFVGNNQTGEDIELFKDGEGRYFYPEGLADGGMFLGGKWHESEALPDPASGTFPVIFGNFNGYAIVERLGLSIQRYNDSNTGINKVEYHVRRRIGGNVVEPWKFAVLKCSVS